MKKHRIGDTILVVISLMILIGLWIYASKIQPKFFPSPAMVYERFQQMVERPIGKTSVLGHVWISLQRVLTAMLISSVLGILTGLAMGWNDKARAIISPLFTALRPIPPIAWIPLVILWFGVGEFPKILLIFIGSYFIVGLNTMAGVAMVDPMYIQVGRIYKAKGFAMLRHIILPAATPAIIAGLKIALGSAWMVVVAAEMIASKSGLGFLITRGSDSGDTPLVLIGMILIGVVGALISFAFSLLERRLCPWILQE